LEAATGRDLLTSNGGLVISGAKAGSSFHGASFFDTTVAAAQRHGVAHQLLAADDIRRRFSPFAVAGDEIAYFEPDAGFVRPEACVAAQLESAQRLGAELRLGQAVLNFEPDGDGVAVITSEGRHVCQSLVLAAGPWAPRLYGARISSPLKVYRQVLYWFDVGDSYAAFTPDRFPVFIWELPHAHGAIYGFPAVGGPRDGFKIATEQYEAETTPETVSREVTEDETAQMFERFVAPFFPDARRTCVRSAVCLYTMTTDFGFIVDRLPGEERVIVASPCSGHGFKHSAALGEAIADLAEGRQSRFDLSAFSLSRFKS
jgi:sarcosine oxidase